MSTRRLYNYSNKYDGRSEVPGSFVRGARSSQIKCAPGQYHFANWAGAGCTYAKEDRRHLGCGGYAANRENMPAGCSNGLSSYGSNYDGLLSSDYGYNGWSQSGTWNGSQSGNWNGSQSGTWNGSGAWSQSGLWNDQDDEDDEDHDDDYDALSRSYGSRSYDGTTGSNYTRNVPGVWKPAVPTAWGTRGGSGSRRR